MKEVSWRLLWDRVESKADSPRASLQLRLESQQFSLRPKLVICFREKAFETLGAQRQGWRQKKRIERCWRVASWGLLSLEKVIAIRKMSEDKMKGRPATKQEWNDREKESELELLETIPPKTFYFIYSATARSKLLFSPKDYHRGRSKSGLN